MGLQNVGPDRICRGRHHCLRDEHSGRERRDASLPVLPAWPGC